MRLIAALPPAAIRGDFRKVNDTLGRDASVDERGLTLLEQAIMQAILAGQLPRFMSLVWFQRNPLPVDWGAAEGDGRV